jgi:uncharacterized DUF497 family protein
MNYNFEWDFNKAKLNLKKHNVSFEQATYVFRDVENNNYNIRIISARKATKNEKNSYNMRK